ncbi:MAG: mechanosensitive ion channel domain-containing protein [Bacteroidota bacterium]
MERFTSFLEYTLFTYQDFKLTIFGILSIILVFVIARAGIWLVQKALARKFSRKRIVDPGRRQALVQILKYVVYFLAILVSMEIVGIKLSLFLAGSAALLVGVGLGLQYTFNDFISGLIILFDGSIQVNDVVQVGDLIGRVKRIGIRATTVISREGISVIVPNAKFTLDNVINWSHNQAPTRSMVQVGVAYGSDVDLVMATITEAARKHPKVERSPEPLSRFVDFGDSALLFEVLFWTRDPFEVEFTKGDIRVRINAAFVEKGIQIPFPQRDLHIISDRRKLQEPV